LFGPYFPFLFIFNGYWEKNRDIFKYFNINLIFEMFLSSDKKVQGPQKQVWGPQFGHACYISSYRGYVLPDEFFKSGQISEDIFKLSMTILFLIVSNWTSPASYRFSRTFSNIIKLVILYVKMTASALLLFLILKDFSKVKKFYKICKRNQK